MHNRPLIGVAVIVINDGRILLGKRKNSHGDGTWAFPGGHSGVPTVKEPQKCEEWQWHHWPPEIEPHFLPIANLLKQDFQLPD
jgi:hypothetical protein